MIRVITDPILHNAILIGLFHPLNQYCRQCLLNYISLNVTALTGTQQEQQLSYNTSHPVRTENIDNHNPTTDNSQAIIQQLGLSNGGVETVTADSAIEDNSVKEKDSADASSNVEVGDKSSSAVENIISDLLVAVEGLVASDSVAQDVISELLGKVEDLVTSDEDDHTAGDPNLPHSVHLTTNHTTTEDNTNKDSVGLNAAVPETNEADGCNPDPAPAVDDDVVAAAAAALAVPDTDGDASTAYIHSLSSYSNTYVPVTVTYIFALVFFYSCEDRGCGGRRALHDRHEPCGYLR